MDLPWYVTAETTFDAGGYTYGFDERGADGDRYVVCLLYTSQKALQALGNFARGARLGGWVGDDERATKISCVHGATPGV